MRIRQRHKLRKYFILKMLYLDEGKMLKKRCEIDSLQIYFPLRLSSRQLYFRASQSWCTAASRTAQLFHHQYWQNQQSSSLKPWGITLYLGAAFALLQECRVKTDRGCFKCWQKGLNDLNACIIFLRKWLITIVHSEKNFLMANYGKAFLITMARKMFTLELEKDLDFIVWKNTCIFPALCRCWSKTGWGAFQEMFGHHCDGFFFVPDSYFILMIKTWAKKALRSLAKLTVAVQPRQRAHNTLFPS